MAKKKIPAGIRTGSRRYEVYNEGLCVYLCDHGELDSLRTLISKKGNPDATFYENLCSPQVAKVVSKKGLALCYELFQDDEIWLEVVVGQPLTDLEMKVARWLPVQRGKLSLPTGQLRIDTANTMPLDPEEKEDECAIAKVKAGEYAVNIYRIDWHACECEDLKYKGPGEILVLTPIDQAEPVSAGSPILECPEQPEDTSWVRQYKIKGNHFECQVNFWDYWEWLRLNLDAKAVQQLKLQCGSVLKIKAGGSEFHLVYLDDISRDDYLTRVGKAHFETKTKRWKEVAMGGWQDFQEHQILSFFRNQADKAVHIKFHEVWSPAAGEVLSETIPLPAEVSLPDAYVKKGIVHATVSLANADLMVINVTQVHLAKFGFTLKLQLPHGIHTVALNNPARELQTMFLAGKEIPGGLYFLKAMGLRAFAFKGKVPKKSEEYDVEILPSTQRRPVVAYFPVITKDPLSRFLHIRQMFVDGNNIGFDWPEPPAIGTPVTLERA